MRGLVAWLFLCLAMPVRASGDYAAPVWLPGGHLQTIWGALAPSPRVDYQRQRWELPDGDFLDLDWLACCGPGADTTPSSAAAAAPLVILFHGLEGSSDSHYAHALMAAVQDRGWRGVVVHFRGCSGEPNRLPRAYHAGDSAEIGYVLTRLRAEHPGRPMFAVAVSLGGNALLKWLGEQGVAAEAVLDRAAAIGAPLDLNAAGTALDSGFNRVYGARFLKSLKRKALAKLQRYPLLYDREALAAVDSIRAFDDLVTAPLHGYRDAADYWSRAASKPGLKHIRVPTLVLNPRNDPIVPADSLPGTADVSSRVTLEQPAEGGHLGFVSGGFPGHLNWLPERVLTFLAAP